MSQKESAKGAAFDFSKFILPIGLVLATGAVCYGLYFGFSYWGKQRLYRVNEVLGQVLEEYDQASQGYPGGWETLQEVSRIAASEHRVGPLASYFIALKALAVSQVDPSLPFAQDYFDAVQLADSSVDSQSVRDLLAVSHALAILDQNEGSHADSQQAVQTLESFYKRLKDEASVSDHFFDEYASYMLAYYYYAHDDIDKAMHIWETIVDAGDASQVPSRWWQLSKTFVA